MSTAPSSDPAAARSTSRPSCPRASSAGRRREHPIWKPWMAWVALVAAFVGALMGALVVGVIGAARGRELRRSRRRR